MAKSKMGTYFQNPSRKLKGLLFLGISLYFALALATYSSTDPSFNRTSYNEISNIFGSYGSFIADPIIQFFGGGAGAVVFILFILSVRNLLKQKISYISARIIAAFCVLLSFCALLSEIPIQEEWPFYVGYGGLVGDLLKSLVTSVAPVSVFISAAAIIFLPSFYFALAIRWFEVKAFCNFVSNVMIKLYNIVVKISVFLVNLARKIMKKSPISVAEKPIKIEAEAKEIIEYKSEKTRKKAVAQQKSLNLEPDSYQLPDFDLLMKADLRKKSGYSKISLEQNARMLKSVLDDFGIKGEIIKVKPGPVVTLYELEPAPGTKSSRVIGLADDIARSMSSISARISVIPGRNVLGIELPNAEREIVYLRELMETPEYQDKRIKLPIALGKDIGGDPIMVDLARMPHLLVAGTTGSGKSVAINAMILSYVYRLTPDECKFIMIDPKMLELSVYDGIPHLLTPVVTEPAKAIVALKWAVREMEDRYRAMSNLGVRNITGYNKKIEEAVKKGKQLERKVQTGFDPETGEPIYEKVPLDMNNLPFIVIIVDEMADLMLTAGKDIEASIQRLAQMARAAGIHMVMATQRPSVDVITGVIKANFPTRISFQVTSRIDSRTILGEMGAEQLLGMGDMLYMAGGGRVTRVHGPFVDDKEVEEVVKSLKANGKPSYIEDITKEEDEGDIDAEGTGDDLYDKAVAIVLRDKKVSTSYIQRQLRIGYNRAANIIEKMEQEGVIGQANHAGKREILVG